MDLRRVALTALGALLVPVASHAAIRAYPLDARSVYTIRLSREEPTTCVFPGALTALEGANVSAKPEDAPAVLLSYRPGGEFFSLRALKDGAAGALNVVFRGRVFVLCFTTGGEPDRAVEFLDEPFAGAERRLPSPDALHALLERAKHHARLAAQFPAVASAIERAEPGSITLYRDFTVTVEEVFRFEAEDTLILRLRFENSGDAVVRYDAQGLAVRIGTEVFPAALAEASGAIPPRATTRGFVAVSGAPHGGRANLSVRENFSVIVPHA